LPGTNQIKNHVKIITINTEIKILIGANMGSSLESNLARSLWHSGHFEVWFRLYARLHS